MRSPLVLSTILLCGSLLHAQQTEAAAQPQVLAAQPQFPSKPATPPSMQEQEQMKARLRERMQAQIAVVQAQHGCPVAVSARRSPVGTMIVTGDATHPAKPVPQALLLHVLGQIAEIKAIAYGPPAGAHVIPVEMAYDEVPEQAQSFTLIGAMRDSAGDFSLRTTRLATVQRIAIMEIDYADGTVWNSSEEHRCVVVPSGYQLIGMKVAK